MKGKLALLALVFAFLFFGCTALEGTDSTRASGEYDAGYSSGSGMAYAPSVDYASEESYSTGTKNILIKEGSLTVKVPEGTLEEKNTRMKEIIRQYGGTIAYMGYNEYTTEKQYWVTVKISPEKFDSFTEALKELGEIKSMDTSLEDVTEQYTDLNTRITNLETELARLNALYEKATKIDDILSIEREITRVQTDLEIYKQQKLDLERRAAKSTVRVTLSEEKPAVQKDLFVPLEELGAIFFGAMGAAIMIIAGAIGFLLPAAVILFVLYLLYKFLRRGGEGKKK